MYHFNVSSQWYDTYHIEIRVLPRSLVIRRYKLVNFRMVYVYFNVLYYRVHTPLNLEARHVLCVWCFQIDSANISELLTSSVDAGCQVTFHPDHVSAKYRLTGSADDVDMSSSPISPTRRCRPRVLGKCDRNWLDRPTSRMCRDGPTGHVYAGLRTFRNRYCALCNHVNETYLRCTPDNQTKNANEESDRYSSGLDNDGPYIVVDMNDKNAVLHSTSNSDDVVSFMLRVSVYGWSFISFHCFISFIRFQLNKLRK